jgi:predicted metal-binding membrane protein
VTGAAASPPGQASFSPGGLSRPGAFWIALILAGLVALAWWQTVVNARSMQSMTAGLAEAGHGMMMSPAPAGFAGMWVVMMAAMMLPGVLPVLLAEAAVQPGPARRMSSGGTLLASYLAVWAAAGLIPFAALTALSRVSQASPRLDQAGGLILVLAGAYQFSRAKQRLLTAGDTRQPGRSAGRAPGLVSPAYSGLNHGLRCLASSCALMIVLLVTGVMSLGWMVVISATCTAEKIFPWRVAVSRTAGAALLGLGLAVLVWPQILQPIGSW